MTQFAQNWISDWNSHDLDRILSHYADDVVFTSPRAAEKIPYSRGTVHGIDQLRAYWALNGEIRSDLNFTLEATMETVNGVTILYRAETGRLVAETMVFDSDGRVIRAIVSRDISAPNGVPRSSMSFLNGQIQAWDMAFWEFSLVFENLTDEDLWRRPDPRLLSVGELVCHLVYALTKYANKFASNGAIESPLALDNARYYLHAVDAAVNLEMSVAEVANELDHVQAAAKEIFLRVDADRGMALPFEGPGETFGEFADYMIFHAAYHTGQAFSVRHLMGHVTNDN